MFTNEQLQSIIAGKMIGEVYPYDTNDERAVLNYLKMIRAEFERLPRIHCEQETLHFGSGYASYVEWFVYTDDNVKISETHGVRTIEKEGLMINISLLAPLVLIGTGDRSDDYLIETGKELSGGKSVLENVSQLQIPESFQELGLLLERLFMKYHYTILQKEDVASRLPFEAQIPTIHRNPHEYIVWDAIFYWED